MYVCMHALESSELLRHLSVQPKWDERCKIPNPYHNKALLFYLSGSGYRVSFGGPNTPLIVSSFYINTPHQHSRLFYILQIFKVLCISTRNYCLRGNFLIFEVVWIIEFFIILDDIVNSERREPVEIRDGGTQIALEFLIFF